ncbi:hypothetical protein [Methanoregula sp. PtaB.Bin085]|uniref:hypothetical protein n=2 Tax=unclassified Methanoregula TaxID=2649730 RepID=UPI0009D102E4|nr:MAG: hypothetical protein A4E33_02424 [Methanoregula sp. PtaB.Bin085]OPY35633.1 MAG: hypothetical protein A4E34_00633 [Methanoregula sp. PtaU1.Bin006]
MVSMDPKAAVMNYQYGERAKSGLIILSQLAIALSGFPDQEKAGGKKMLLMMMESVRTELAFAHRGTSHREFNRAINSLSEAISLVESNQPEQASQKIAQAVSAVTTPAAEAWQVLSEHGLV